MYVVLTKELLEKLELTPYQLEILKEHLKGEKTFKQIHKEALEEAYGYYGQE